jgi:hypothetical protein
MEGPWFDAASREIACSVPHGGTVTPLTGTPARTVDRARHVRTLRLIPPVVTLIVCLIGIDSASFWRDEAATLDAEARSLPDLLRMLTQVDAVHGAYYLTLWPVVHIFGGSEFAVRFPSALAMAAAAFGVGLLGTRLHSRAAGVLAGWCSVCCRRSADTAKRHARTPSWSPWPYSRRTC